MISGIYAINKPKGLSSNQAIQKIKKALKLKKIGHGGTLDPLATGVLIIGINNATKDLFKHLNDPKQYLATIEFGYSTDTYDIEGKTIATSNVIPDLTSIKNFCDYLLNHEYYQQVPLFSAVKFNGKELYKYARNNDTTNINLPSKLVKLIGYELISFNNNILIIKLDVSKGFYIRSFVNDLAKHTNSCATMIALERTRSGNFELSDAYSIDAFINRYLIKA